MTEKRTRSFLKWAGGKYGSLGFILPTFPTATRLIEPFSGSGVVFMNTDYSDYVLADTNPDLIALYQYIQCEGASFIDDCEQLFCQENNCKEEYEGLRNLFNSSADQRVRSALFLYLNRHGFNGLCRYNRQGGYNVPFGFYKKAPYFPRNELLSFHQKSQNATLIHGDFRTTFDMAMPGDVIYCDPPYAPVSKKSIFTSYTGTVFEKDDHVDLTEYAINAAKRDIPVIISNHDTDFTRNLYRHAEIASFSVRRSISCNGKNRAPAQELLAIFNSSSITKMEAL